MGDTSEGAWIEDDWVVNMEDGISMEEDAGVEDCVDDD